MIRDSSYWEGHIPTREEYEEISHCCDEGDCYSCPYYWDEKSHCDHFDIGDLPLTYLKEAEKKIKVLESVIEDLKDCLQETEKDLQNLMKEKEKEPIIYWSTSASVASDLASKISLAADAMSTSISSTIDAMSSLSTAIAEEDLPF